MTKLTWQEMLNRVRAENPGIKKQTKIFRMAKERYNQQVQTPEIVLNTPIQQPAQNITPFEQHPVMQQVPIFTQPPQLPLSRRQLIRQNNMENKKKAYQYDNLFRPAGYRVIKSSSLSLMKIAATMLSLAVIGLLYLNFRSLL